jgi:hypothetical protein
MPNAPTVLNIPPRLQPLASLAMLLERLERQPRQASAEQYRRVAGELKAQLANAPDDPALDRILRLFPAAAELYENLRYEHAGLCLSHLDAAVPAEQQAHAVIARLRKPH